MRLLFFVLVLIGLVVGIKPFYECPHLDDLPSTLNEISQLVSGNGLLWQSMTEFCDLEIKERIKAWSSCFPLPNHNLSLTGYGEKFPYLCSFEKKAK